MKRFFSKNKKLGEILLTLGLVFLAGGYYYFIYIPERENEIIARRFRALQRIERNMQEKLQGYQATMMNCLARADKSNFAEIVNIVKGYNTDTGKFHITNLDTGLIQKTKNIYLKILSTLTDSTSIVSAVNTSPDIKKITITGDWYKLQSMDSIKHISLSATIDYKEFVRPLLKKNVFDQYILFNIERDATSNTVFEDFNSGISFKGLDSLFETKEKFYTSRIIKIETAGEKYLAFLHPCGHGKKNDRILMGLLKQETLDKEKRQLPERLVTTIIFITLLSFLLLPVTRLALMGKKERIRFNNLFAGYFSFLLLVPVIILVFLWNHKRFLSDEQNKQDSKKELAEQISKSFNSEIDSAYALLEKIDTLYHSDTTGYNLSILNKLTIRNLNHTNTATAYADSLFIAKENLDNRKYRDSVNAKVKELDSILNPDSARHINAYSVFWMKATTGEEIASWSFRDNPMPGNYKNRDYFKNVLSKNEISIKDEPNKNFAISPIFSRTDGKYKIAIAKRSKNESLVVAYTSRFVSVMNPVLPMGYEFSITDAGGNTIFDSDTTKNLNENLLEEFVNHAKLKVAFDTKSSLEFTTRHEDEDYNVLVQPIGGLPYFIVIRENQAFNSSLYSQSLSFTIVMMFSFFLFLCLEIVLIIIAHHQSTKLQKNSFDFSWVYPQKSLSSKYFALSLYNAALIIALSLFCFINFSIQRLTEYIFLFILAALISSIAVFAFKPKDANSSSTDKKKSKKEKSAVLVLSLLVIIVLINAYYFSLLTGILLFLTVSILLFIILYYQKNYIKEKCINNYMGNFRLMVFSRLLLTSGFPVIVFFNCIYDFEHKLEERLKLLDYAKKIEQRTKHGENLQSIFCQISKKDTIRGFYYDTRWILPVTDTTSSIDTTPEILIDTLYTNEDSFCISLLKTSRLHYNDVSDNTENFELIKPFGNDSAKFAFNSILSNCRDTLKYGITTFRENKPKELIISDEKSKEEIIPRVKEVSYDTAITKYFALSSGLNKYAFPSITKFGGLVFWMMLLGSLSLCYLLLIYATNKFFGKNIPGIDDFNTMPVALLKDDKIKYLFVQGAPNADKSFFVQNHLEADKYTFYDKTNPEHTYNAKIFNLTEIPDEEEMSLEKESFEKQLIPAFLQEDNWYYKISKLANKNIECIVFTHFEYKIFDEHTNRHKLNLIENIIRLNKKKIIISSDIDPVEYFHSLKMFMNTNVGNNNKKTESKNDSKIFGKDPDTNASFFEYINRWNNLLGRFANIYINNNSPAVEENKSPADKQNSNDHLNPSETFLKNECCNTGFSDTFKKQFDTVAFNEKNEEDYILKIQSLCDHSYRHIWSSLTKEEQLILYDLAEDGLLNTTNYISLTMLLNKGLVVKDAEGLLMIINRSFRNFILTVVNSDEVKNIEKEISDDHTWNDYKYPVLIILGAFLYFALSSNPEKFGNTLPLISGVAAGITTILKLLSFMKPGETKG